VLQPPPKATAAITSTATTAAAAEGTSLAAAAALTLGGSINPLLPLTSLSGSSLSHHLASRHFTGSQSLAQRSGIVLGKNIYGDYAAPSSGGSRRKLSSEDQIPSAEGEEEGSFQLEVYNGENNDDDNGEEEEVFEESEASRVAREGAAHVHWQSGLTLLANCEAPDARLEAFEAAAVLGHAQVIQNMVMMIVV